MKMPGKYEGPKWECNPTTTLKDWERRFWEGTTWNEEWAKMARLLEQELFGVRRLPSLAEADEQLQTRKVNG